MTGFLQTMTGFVLQITGFVLNPDLFEKSFDLCIIWQDFGQNVTGFALTITIFVFNIIQLGTHITGFVLNMTGFVLNMAGLVLNINGFFLNLTELVLNIIGFVPGWHKLHDRATSGLRPRSSCKAKMLTIYKWGGLHRLWLASQVVAGLTGWCLPHWRSLKIDKYRKTHITKLVGKCKNTVFWRGKLNIGFSLGNILKYAMQGQTFRISCGLRPK